MDVYVKWRSSHTTWRCVLGWWSIIIIHLPRVNSAMTIAAYLRMFDIWMDLLAHYVFKRKKTGPYSADCCQSPVVFVMSMVNMLLLLFTRTITFQLNNGLRLDTWRRHLLEHIEQRRRGRSGWYCKVKIAVLLSCGSLLNLKCLSIRSMGINFKWNENW